MSEPTLYYTPGTCALSCIVTLRWLEIPFQLCRVEGTLRRDPEYRSRVNAHGKVPTLRDDDFLLTENGAILPYLAAKNPSKGLLPEPGSRERARFDEWLFYFDSGYHGAYNPVFKPQLYTDDEALHDVLKKRALVNVEGAYTFIDEKLEGREFFMGDSPGILDAYFFAMSRWGPRVGVTVEGRFPNVQRHMDTLARDPGVRFALGVEAGEVVEADGAFRGHVSL